MKEQMITVGKILKPHGIKGDLKILPLTDNPEKRFKSGKTLFINNDVQSLPLYTIEKIKPYSKGTFLLKLNMIDSIDEAEKICGCYLTIPQDDIAPLEDGSYYIFQIQGLDVYEDNGEYLGKISEVQQTSSNDIYIIKDNNGKELLIPALKEVVTNVDLNNKKMVVKLLPGLR